MLVQPPSSLAAQVQGPSCKCGQLGCMCDLSLEDNFGDVFLPLGYDTCVEEGGCEACSEREIHLAYCAPTGQRQRVVCSRCSSSSTISHFCASELRVIWSSNASSAVTGMSNLRASNVSKGASAGLFFRSCGTRQSSNTEAPLSPAVNGTVGPLASLPAQPPGVGSRSVTEETTQVLCFVAFNAAVLALTVRSLRRQQHAVMERTMEGLYSCVGATEPSAILSPRRDSKASDRRGAAPTPSANGVAEEMMGRPMESFAAAVARTSNALELAVREGGAGSEQKMK